MRKKETKADIGPAVDTPEVQPVEAEPVPSEISVDVPSVAGRVLTSEVPSKKADIEALYADAQTLAGAVLGSLPDHAQGVVVTGTDPAEFKGDGARVLVTGKTTYYSDGTHVRGLEYVFAVTHNELPDPFDVAAILVRALNNSPEAVARINR